MGVDLRLFVVRTTDIERTRGQGRWMGIVPVAKFEMIRRKDLWDDITNKIKFEPLETTIIQDDEEFNKDHYGGYLEYCDCNELSNVILTYNEEFRHEVPYKNFYNDAVAHFLQSVSDQCVAVLYWR